MADFNEIAEGWIFCTQRLLRYRIERCRVLMSTDAQRATVAKMMDRYLEEVAAYRKLRIKDREPVGLQDLILQQNREGMYAGPLIHGRFQVMESLIPGSYYLADHTKPDLLLREGGPASEIRRFDTIDQAKEWAGRLANDQPGAVPAPNKGPTMPAKKSAATMSLPATGNPRGRVVPASAAPAVRGQATKAKATANGEKKPTASALFRELIMEGKLTDDKIFETVQKRFGLDEKKRSYVAWYRNDLTKQGQKPPAPVGGAAPKMTQAEKVARMQAGKAAKQAAKAAPLPKMSKKQIAEAEAVRAAALAKTAPKKAGKGKHAGA